MLHTHGRDFAITQTSGIDSTVLAYWILENLDLYDKDFFHPVPPNHKPRCALVSCNYGQKTWAITEKCARYHLEELQKRYGHKANIDWTVIDVTLPSWTKEGGLFKEGYTSPTQKEIVDHTTPERRYSDCYVDGLSSILYSWMMAWCSKDKIPLLLCGHQLEVNEWPEIDQYTYRTDDSSPWFLDRMNLQNECGFQNRCRVEAPFSTLRFSKYDIVACGKRLRVDFHYTYSCQFCPPDGKCDNCVIRRKAFAMLNIEDTSMKLAEECA